MMDLTPMCNSRNLTLHCYSFWSLVICCNKTANISKIFKSRVTYSQLCNSGEVTVHGQEILPCKIKTFHCTLWFLYETRVLVREL